MVERFYPVTVHAPHDLQALLATMKSAKEKSINMNIWDRDIKAVQDAITTIEALREANRTFADLTVLGVTQSQAKEPEADVTNARCGDGAMGSSRHVAGRTATTTSENLDVTARRDGTLTVAQPSWMSIETVPLDGVEVDIWCLNISDGKSVRFPAMFKTDEGKWEDWHGYTLEPKWRPTHWISCPAGPSVSSTHQSADRNWIEDAPHENGNYECSCVECGHPFTGHKRRVLCKLCSNLLIPSVSSTPRATGEG